MHLTGGLVFLLTRLQAHAIVDGPSDSRRQRLVAAGLVFSAVVVLGRFVWGQPASADPKAAEAVA